MSAERESVTLPMIPEPVALKEAYQRGELTADEALDILIFGAPAAHREDERDA